MRFIKGLIISAPIVALAFTFQPSISQAQEKKAAPAAAKAAPASSQQSQVDRGKYLITFGGCHDCHSPKVKGAVDQKRILMGQPAGEKLAGVPQGLIAPDKWGTLANNHLTAWVGPWGVSFAANLTPDKETGLGNWTPEMFIAALRTGKNRGTGRNILPPMPWEMYKGMSDADLRAMFAYLQSIPPIKNLVPAPLPPNMIPK